MFASSTNLLLFLLLLLLSLQSSTWALAAVPTPTPPPAPKHFSSDVVLLNPKGNAKGHWAMDTITDRSRLTYLLPDGIQVDTLYLWAKNLSYFSAGSRCTKIEVNGSAKDFYHDLPTSTYNHTTQVNGQTVDVFTTASNDWTYGFVQGADTPVLLFTPYLQKEFSHVDMQQPPDSDFTPPAECQ